MLAQISRLRMAQRRRRGAVQITMPETSVRVEGADIHGGGRDATARQRQPPRTRPLPASNPHTHACPHSSFPH